MNNIEDGYREGATIPDLSDPDERKKLSRAGIRGYVAIAKKWSLTDAQALGLLGASSSSTLIEWQAKNEGQTLDEDTLMRISYTIGIFKALQYVWGKNLADRWITLRNRGTPFSGDSPLDYMVREGQPGMQYVRRLLDAWAAGNY
jgi:hypothetical protein